MFSCAVTLASSTSSAFKCGYGIGLYTACEYSASMLLQGSPSMRDWIYLICKASCDAQKGNQERAKPGIRPDVDLHQSSILHFRPESPKDQLLLPQSSVVSQLGYPPPCLAW